MTGFVLQTSLTIISPIADQCQNKYIFGRLYDSERRDSTSRTTSTCSTASTPYKNYAIGTTSFLYCFAPSPSYNIRQVY